MLLAIDVGNTNTVFGVYDGTRFIAEWRCATNHARTADEYFVWLDSLMRASGIAREAIGDAIVAQVVPQTQFNLRCLCARYFDCNPLFVGDKNVSLGISVKLERPSEVGADRLVNAVAAFQNWGGNMIVLDFGTATTFDVIDENGAYVGGVIAPGVNLSVEALCAAASRLPRIDVTLPARVVGKDTIGAMESGVYFGYVSLIDGIAARIARERGCRMRVVATGGLCELFAREARSIEAVDPLLTLHGLALVHRRNRRENGVR